MYFVLFRFKPARDDTFEKGLDAWYKKGVAKTAATKFRKGACSNCGAMTHKLAEVPICIYIYIYSPSFYYI